MTSPSVKLHVRLPSLATQLSAVTTIAWREWLTFRRHIVDATTGPIFSAGLYLLVFTVALGPAMGRAAGQTVLGHIAPGLVVLVGMLVAAQNVTATVLMSRQENSLSNLLMAPISPAAFVGGYVLASLIGGGLVSLGVFCVAALFVMPTPNWPVLLGFVVLGIVAFALTGLLFGLWARKWDQFSIVYDMGMVPLTVLSGVYLPVQSLPEPLQNLARCSPLTYIVSGVRHGYTGQAELPLIQTASVTIAAVILLASIAMTLVSRSWRLRE
jgi:ABC-2 type transport system permease protein